MANDELKKRIAELKKKKKDKEESKKLEKELKQLEEEAREKTKTQKVVKGIGKGMLEFAKASNKFFEKQAKKKR